MRRKLTCIACPRGCELTVRMRKNTVTMVLGNHCAAGKRYAEQECVNPMRSLTALMRCRGREKPFSVKASGLLPKEQLLQCVLALRRYHPAPPVKRGDVLIVNVCGTGRDIVATSDYSDE